MAEDRWVDVRQAAEYFGLPRGTVCSLAARGQFPVGAVLRLGRQIRINIEVIEAGSVLNSRRRQLHGTK